MVTYPSCTAQIEHLPQTSPELHAQLQAIVRERGAVDASAGVGHLPAGLVAPEAGGDGVATNMQAQSDYLRDMVVSPSALSSVAFLFCGLTAAICVPCARSGARAPCG